MLAGCYYVAPVPNGHQSGYVWPRPVIGVLHYSMNMKGCVVESGQVWGRPEVLLWESGHYEKLPDMKHSSWQGLQRCLFDLEL